MIIAISALLKMTACLRTGFIVGAAAARPAEYSRSNLLPRDVASGHLLFLLAAGLEDLDRDWNRSEGADCHERPSNGSPLIIIQTIGEEQPDPRAQQSARSADDSDLGDG
jgi:hypothetical protein